MSEALKYDQIMLDFSRDNLLTTFAKKTLEDRYLHENETYQSAFARVASAFADDIWHAQRMYDYISKLWFIPSTPVLANGGSKQGLPISCYLNETEDNLAGIVKLWEESIWLASLGGGIGSYMGNVRSIGESIEDRGSSSGVIPFIKVTEALSLAISQGSLRRGSTATYIPIWHPEIEEFIEMRKPTGGDLNRKTIYLHHGVIIDDKFMEAVSSDSEYALISPKTKQTIRMVSARALFIRLLTTRLETGEPYLLFIDTINRAIPEHHKKLGLLVKTSNLCSEITLPTGKDHLGNDRTAVCCLGSVNLEFYADWYKQNSFIEDIMRFLDNVLEHFIQTAPDVMSKAKYAAERERSVGLGALGWCSLLQKRMIPFESVTALALNKQIFSFLRSKADLASVKLAHERGPCLDAKEVGVMERFSNKLAVAPNASTSIIAGSSPSIEPIAANSFTHKTLSGSHAVRNKYLSQILVAKAQDTEEVWSSITINKGSVQHLSFLSEQEKDVFKTAFELNQMWIIEHASARAEYICQAQSLNIFIPADIHKSQLLKLHYLAWKKNIKSLYYCRSQSVQRAEAREDALMDEYVANNLANNVQKLEQTYDECVACQ